MSHKIAMIEAREGKFFYPAQDTYIGKCLEQYGEWEQRLVDFSRSVVPEGGVIVEVGANIGSHTVPLAHHIGPEGVLYAFEPQRLIFQMLCANLVCNEVFNVNAVHAAVGDQVSTIMVPEIEIGSEYNFGAVTVGGLEGKRVPVVKIDDLNLERCDYIKVDAEGFEPQTMLGAYETIKRHKPVIYLEYNPHVQKTINFYIRQFMSDYKVWSFNEPIFKKTNFFENQEDHFVNIYSMGIVASVNDIPGVTDELESITV